MKRIILMAAFLGAAMSAMAEANIKWLEVRHNFGVFDEGNGPVSCEFKFVNTGDEPLTILSARASCGCTQPSYPQEQIAPGDTAALEVAFNPAGRPGRFSKTISVETNAATSRIKLTIEGTVIGSQESVALRYPVDKGALQLRNNAAVFGQVTRPHLKTVFVEGYNRSADTLEMKVLQKPKYIDINFEPKETNPGEQVSIICYLRSGEAGMYGFFEDSVKLSDGRSEFWLPVTANVVEDFSKMSAGEREKAPEAKLDHESIDMGRFSGEDALKGSVELSNMGKNPLEIRRVYSPDAGVSASIDRTSIKKGKTATITVDVDPKALTGELLNARVTVITNDPDNPVRTIRVVGMKEK